MNVDIAVHYPSVQHNADQYLDLVISPSVMPKRLDLTVIQTPAWDF